MATPIVGFNHLGSIIQGNEEIDDNIGHYIRVGCRKWRRALEVLSDNKILTKLKGKVCCMVVKLISTNIDIWFGVLAN